MDTMRIRQLLIIEQQRQGVTNREMAKRLEMKIRTWYALKSGRRGVSLKTVHQALMAFPTISGSIMAQLAPHSARDSQTITPPTARQPGEDAA